MKGVFFFPGMGGGGERLVCGQRCVLQSATAARPRVPFFSPLFCNYSLSTRHSALSRKESPPRQRLNVYLVSRVPDTSRVRIKAATRQPRRFCSFQTQHL